jgi:single-stranded DNA-binding protein
MKGFRTSVTVQGYSLAEGEMSYTPGGKAVTHIRVAVGGNKEKGIMGVVFRCVAWEDNAERVQKAVSLPGLAVLVTGRLTQRTKTKGDKVYVNNDLNIDQLAVQLQKSDTNLSEIVIERGAAAVKPGGNGDASGKEADAVLAEAGVTGSKKKK